MFLIFPNEVANLLILISLFFFLLGILAIIGITVCTLIDDRKNSKPCPTKRDVTPQGKRKHNYPHQ